MNDDAISPTIILSGNKFDIPGEMANSCSGIESSN
jgi:hypothetical protein